MSIYNSLVTAGIDNPGLETRMIEDYAKRHNLSQDQVNEIINQRILKTPLDKLLGEKGFYKHIFCVSENVLSPRPDTEVLVEKAVDIIKVMGKGASPRTILDLGTGSGCILLSILSDIPDLIGVGVDISAAALDIAKQNAAALQLENRVEFFQRNWFKDKIEGHFDVIVSNPPYIPSTDIPNLDVEVKDHDPMLALDGGQDGLDSYRKIAEIIPNLLNKDGYVLLEVGINQAQDVANIFTKAG
ncbi:MAG: peptide chain release factor N(5)-glutamine methyltransferase, partial [Lactobacillus sp.]|nr:peptide chain release factor N(5)-glutamine methyltransferase [Lactobacillus sp.]